MKTKEIKKQYNHLENTVKTHDFYTKVDLTNRVNCYTCPEGHVTKTQDVDAGVTPFMLACKHDECERMAVSSMYKDICPDIIVTHEWYRPDLKDTLKLKLTEIRHVLDGGLILRRKKVSDE